jgi:large conductance mechanosensitive channel
LTVLAEFKKFLMRGNLVDLAIAVIIGLAFKSVVDTFTNGIVLPIIAAIGGKANFNDIGFTVNHSFFAVGAFLNALLNFVVVGAVCFAIIKAYERLNNLRRIGAEVDAPVIPEDVVLLTEIRDLLARR